MDICIISKKELKKSDLKGAKKVKDDRVIKTIRGIKKALKMATNNKLYVCKDMIQEHNKRRSDFERSLLITTILGLIIFLGLGFIPIFATGEFAIGPIIIGLVIAVLLILLAGFLKYTPEVEK